MEEARAVSVGNPALADRLDYLFSNFHCIFRLYSGKVSPCGNYRPSCKVHLDNSPTLLLTCSNKIIIKLLKKKISSVSSIAFTLSRTFTTGKVIY
jgi:hypothetical protein